MSAKFAAIWPIRPDKINFAFRRAGSRIARNRDERLTTDGAFGVGWIEVAD